MSIDWEDIKVKGCVTKVYVKTSEEALQKSLAFGPIANREYLDMLTEERRSHFGLAILCLNQAELIGFELALFE